MHNRIGALHRVNRKMVQKLPSASLLQLLFLFIPSRGADEHTACVTVTSVCVDGVFYALIKGLQFSGRCVFRLLLPGGRVSQIFQLLRVELLCTGPKDLSMDFPLCLRLLVTLAVQVPRRRARQVSMPLVHDVFECGVAP